MVGVYCIRQGKKFYVGQSTNVEARWRWHERRLRQGRHDNPRLQHAWDLHGKDTFSFELIETCEADVLTEVEQKWIDALDSFHSGYNCGPAADCPFRGSRHTDVTRQKMVEAAKHRPPVSDETRRKLSESGVGRKMPPISDETRAKMSEASRSRAHEISDLMKRVHTGRKLSQETRRKMSEAHKRRAPMSEETRQKIAEARRQRHALTRLALTENQLATITHKDS